VSDELESSESKSLYDAYQKGIKEGIARERERCISMASRDIYLSDEVSGAHLIRKPNCTCAKDIAGEVV